MYHLLFSQSSTRHVMVLSVWQTKAVRIRCCFFSQNSISPVRAWHHPATTRAVSPPARNCGGTALSGGPLPNKSFTRPTIGRRTPARRSEKHWWRSATGEGRKSGKMEENCQSYPPLKDYAFDYLKPEIIIYIYQLVIDSYDNIFAWDAWQMDFIHSSQYLHSCKAALDIREYFWLFQADIICNISIFTGFLRNSAGFLL